MIISPAQWVRDEARSSKFILTRTNQFELGPEELKSKDLRSPYMRVLILSTAQYEAAPNVERSFGRD